MSAASNRLLIFSVRGTDYLLELRDLSEVMETAEIFPIPLAPSHFIGAMNAHGSPVAVLDIAAFIGTGSAMPDGKILLLDRRLANLALWVDQVKRIVSEDQVSDGGTVDEEFTSRIFVTDEGPLKLLNLERLLKRLEEGINM